MIKKIILFTIFLSINSINAQSKLDQDFNTKVNSLDQTVKTFYSIISGEKNEERNWDLFKFLFKEGAEITLNISSTKDQKKKYYLTIDEFISSYGKWLISNGFFASETNRSISTFQHLNYVSSTYEYNNYDNNGNFTSTNSINLVKENNRWYISNLKWNQKFNDYKIINEYLPVSEN